MINLFQKTWLLANTAEGIPILPALNVELVALGKAILILILGWIVAGLVKSTVKKLLRKTHIDNRIAVWIAGSSGADDAIAIEKILSDIAYWLVIIFATVAFLNALNLQAVSAPLNSLLEQVTSFLPKIAGAALLLGLAWVVATLGKILAIRTIKTFRLDERLSEQISEESPTDEEFTEEQTSLSEAVGSAVYWLIFLVFLPSILSTLQLEGTLQPVQVLLNDILATIPKLLGAVIIGLFGWLVAQVVRRVVTNSLAAFGVDQLGNSFNLRVASPGGKPLSWNIGTLVYIFILIPTAIAALNALEIRAISEPAIAMLDQILNFLPKLLAAFAVLAAGYFAGKYISGLVTQIFKGIGFDNIFTWLGFPPDTENSTSGTSSTTGTPTVLQSTTYSPSDIVGVILLVGVMLVATVTAVDILEIETLQTLVQGFLVIAAQVLVGIVVFAVGLYLANLAFKFISKPNTPQSIILAQTARTSVIVLTSAMALQQMGIASNIVNLAFGLLVGAIAVAFAIAFGVGGRDVAAEQLRKWLNSFNA